MSKTLNEDDVLKEIDRWIGYLDEDMITRIKIGIKKLPSAQPEQCDDPRADIYYLAEKIGIHRLYALVVELRGEPEPCEDAVSRQAVEDVVDFECGEWRGLAKTIIKKIKDMPSVTPKAEQRWIPVSERLPKEYGEYICTMENGQVQECGFVPENQRELVDGWSTCEADGHKFLGYADVLAWMPLPEPWKEGEADD